MESTIMMNFVFNPTKKGIEIKCFHCSKKWNKGNKKPLNKQQTKALLTHYKKHYPTESIS